MWNPIRQVPDFLREVRAVVEAGWCQGVTFERRGNVECHCIVGALGNVEIRHGATGKVHKLRMDASEALRRAADVPFLAAWNDAPDRTQADVLALIDKAIEAAR